MSGALPTPNSFLGNCDPRAKLLAFFLLMPLLLSQPFTTPGGWVALLFVSIAIIAAKLNLRLYLQQLKRLRWLFFALWFFHALLTPGQPVLPGLTAISQEGAVAGVSYSVRLVLMVTLSWVLIKTTTHGQIVAAFKSLFGFLEKFGVPLERGLGLLAFTLGRIPHLISEAGGVKRDMDHRLGVGTSRRWLEKLYSMAQAGEALLFRLLRCAHAQEEALRVRGILHGLPVIPPLTTTFGWRDGAVLISVLLGVAVPFLG
ncbi:MAG: energy-coupling factor transporter transmembrane protein EcfT [Magnetococcales bacterium]|nr:energy-coupling factor transporter transmembrane protein EcfT [Magnetococcales bacterium]